MHDYEIKPLLAKKLKKIQIKDRKSYEKIEKTIFKILETENINHYKNLRGTMKNFKRVHIGSYVIIFEFKDNKIIFTDYDHHDKIYNQD